MPRRNHPRHRSRYENGGLPANRKPGGKKRPKKWHNGPQRGEQFAEADRLMREAEERA